MSRHQPSPPGEYVNSKKPSSPSSSPVKPRKAKALSSPAPVTRKALLLGVTVLLASLIVITTTYHIATSHTVPSSSTSSPTAKSAAKQLPTATASSGSGSVQLTPHPPSPTGTPPYIVQNPNPATVLGVDSDPGTYYAGIHWVRLGYPTCGWGDLSGNHLKTTMRNYHNLGLHVLLIICQAAPSGPRLFAQQQFTDVAP